MSLPIRLQNLPGGAKLDLVPIQANLAAGQPVKIAVQLPTGGRVVSEFPASTTLWDILKHVEELEPSCPLTSLSTDDGTYMQPTCTLMGQQVRGILNFLKHLFSTPLYQTSSKRLCIQSG